MSKGYVSPNTHKNTDWAVRCFREWMSARNKTVPEGDKHYCPQNLLDEPEVEKVNYWMSRFVAEVQNKKWEPYPPRSIHQLLTGQESQLSQAS